ncbi:hypothetical protein Micbo1qcDRAFT_198253 [Microdochium bolleyi]|uniref:Uncharacterized protein n=1 Tax=Microdochium bolleyi TaxID=196109 RepID=A0A136INN8_9PEZI|nr:hypothetical protein Micbo1qcDRAFT_198253 [Microdochium bolleyi]
MGSPAPETNPLDSMTTDSSPDLQAEQQQRQQYFEVQQLDPDESAEDFDLSPPLQVSGHGQVLMWKNCIAHVYHSHDDRLPVEQVPLGNGKCIVPHGTSVWLAGRRGSIKQRAAISP